MKLASFSVDGRNRLGAAISDTEIIDLFEAASASGMDVSAPAPLLDMGALIEAGIDGLHQARNVVTAAMVNDKAPRYSLSEISWLPPVRRPSKIVCLALNNSANKDRIIKGPNHPATFIKGANALVGHGQPIVIKPDYGRTHPEPELAVVISKEAKEVSEEDALAHVFGYTVHNDITSPTMREDDTFHYRAIHPSKTNPDEIEYKDTWVSYPGRYKGSDTFSPMGPWLVTRDEVPDCHVLDITCSHQGELITADNTANLFYKLPQVIAFLTHYMTLLPGDIVSMGTALKKSGGKAVQNIPLHEKGGPVTVSIESIGTLENPVEFRK
jgi:2-keto-4-pentenoate hydratase/2-oxohepta-3-ene-1,7-dioic acid hydratase in catechol pathway